MKTNDSNPLLKKQFNIPFDKIQPEQIAPAVNTLLDQAKQKLEDLINSKPEQRTFENTILAYEAITENLEFANNIIEHLKLVDNNEGIVNAHKEILPKLTDFNTQLLLNDRLYAIIKEYAKCPEAGHLKGPRKRFLTQVLDSFRRSGAELDAHGKHRLSQIEMELAGLCSDFGQRVLDSTNSYSLLIKDESRLSGLPEFVKQSAKELAKKKNEDGWMFTLHAPSIIPALNYADDRELRKELYLAYTTIASSGKTDNRDNIVQILKLRDEKAKLLGYRDFADYILENRMAKNGNNVQGFLKNIRAKVKPHVNREHKELVEFYHSLEGENAPPLESWDTAYYAEKQCKAKYDFDMEELRPYFALNNVVKGLFDLINKLYGITIEPTSDIATWKGEGIQTYKVLDENGTWLGSFYTDYFPRKEKRAGAWMNFLYAGGPQSDGSFQPHLAFNCGNLNPPLGDKPALLSPIEARTIFHEFGHLMHQILSTAEIRTHSGPTSVSWDFVEFPSQIMENWLKESIVLEKIASHYETGEKIPQELLAKMMNAENYRSASFIIRQLSFGLMDQDLHTRYDPKSNGDVVEYCRDFMQGFAYNKLPEGYSMVTAFTHLFSDPVGYAAGYYSYMWASALEADAFTRFKSEGLYSRKLGTELKEKILAKGDGEDAAVIFHDFMGRELDSEALLKRNGLL